MFPKKNTNKSIFVSSTFCDMQAERDALRDIVLPRINEFAGKYGRAVEIIDLRWGVDTDSVSEAEQNRKVLRTCLDEIERSKPFFIALIGDRYGWTPPRKEMEAALNFALFSLNDLNISVTAMEIEYGVLCSDMPPVCLFYFRESPDYESMSEDIIRIYRDRQENLEKLERLKEKIRSRFSADLKNYTAEIHENGLTVSKDWTDMVEADIIEKLRQEWGEPSNTPLSWKENEIEMQDAFRKSRTEYFIGRTATVADMTAFCLGNDSSPQLLMIQGEAGSGKSGLLCRVMDTIEDKCLLLPFCCGISSRSSLVENMLRYFIMILCEKLALKDDSDALTKFQELKDRFVDMLFAACRKMRVVAVVDALDQFAGSDEARRMLWISGQLPENFRMLCSIINGAETETIKQLDGNILPVPPIDAADETAIIKSIAVRHRKQINRDVVEYILKKQTTDGVLAAQNPLYLSLIAIDLAMMNRYEFDTVQQYIEGGMYYSEALTKFMQQRIDETPGDPEGAYLAILSRMEKLIGREFVSSVCGMIAVSRSGLRENDMEGAFKKLGIKFIPADFSWLRQMLRGHFSQGDMQQWNFSHQSLRRAIKKDYPDELKRLNDGIIAHFQNVIDRDNFSAREIMHHICASNRSDLAVEVMTTHGGCHCYELAQGLADAYLEYENGTEFCLNIPTICDKLDEVKRLHVLRIIDTCLLFLPENTRLFRIELLQTALNMIKGQTDFETRRAVAIVENHLAKLYIDTGQTEKAGVYLQKSINTMEQLYNQNGTISVLIELSAFYNDMGEYKRSLGRIEEAREFHKKSITAFEQLYAMNRSMDDLSQLAASYYNMGVVMMAQGCVNETEEYYKKSVDAHEQLYAQRRSIEDMRRLAASYDEMGTFLMTLNNVDQAGEYYKKSLEYAKKAFEQSGAMLALRDLAYSYYSMGVLLCELDYLVESGEHFQRSLKAREKIFVQSGTTEAMRDLATSYAGMGGILTKMGQVEESGEYFQKSVEMFEQLFKQSGSVYGLAGLAEAYKKMSIHLTILNSINEAVDYSKKSVDAREYLYKKMDTSDNLRCMAISYADIGETLVALDRNEEALKYHMKNVDAMEKLYKQTNTVDDLKNLAASYQRIGNFLREKYGLANEAEKYYLKRNETFKLMASKKL